MCERCIQAVREKLPLIGENDIGAVLWNGTAFPFGDADLVEKQIGELAAKTDGTLGAIMAYADAEIQRAMEEALKT